MKCKHCGADCADSAKYCTCCGEPLQTQTVPAAEAAEQDFSVGQTFSVGQEGEMPEVKESFRTKLLSLCGQKFLALCILETIATCLALVAGISNTGVTFDLLGILATIFLWIVYSSAKKGTVDGKNLRRLSGVAYAQYIISLVVGAILAVAGVLLCVLAPNVEEMPGSLESLFGDNLDEIMELGLTMVLIVMGVVLICIGVMMFIFALCGYRKIHSFTKSLYQSADADACLLQNAEKAGSWMLVFGILQAIGILSGGFGVGTIANGCGAAVLILGYVLVKDLRAKMAEN